MSTEIIIFTHLICFFGAIFFLFKFPAANWILGWTLLVGDSSGNELGTFYSRTVYIILGLSFGSLYMQGDAKQTLRAIISKFRKGRFKLFSLIVMVILIKIILETSYFGLDFYRVLNLKKYVYFVLFPILITMLSLIKNHSSRALHHFTLGFCFYSTVIAFVTIITGLNTSQFLLGDQLTFGEMDTINGGRFLYFAALSYLIAALANRKRMSRNFYSILSLISYVFVLLNGQRQFIIGYLVGVLGVLILFGDKKRKRLPIFVLIFGLGASLVFINRNMFADAAFISRMSVEKLELEKTVYRGRLWLATYDLAKSKPLTGIGFGNFGEKFLFHGIYKERKGTAHGFFQEIMVEHGFFLLGLSVLSFLYIFFTNFRKTIILRQSDQVIFLFSFFLISFPENFSGIFLNCLGYHFFALSPFLFQKQSWIRARSSPTKKMKFLRGAMSSAQVSMRKIV